VGVALRVAARAGNGGLLERARLGLSLALWALAACHGDESRAARTIPGEGAPRVTVEVLNAGARAGLARVATRLLRDAGIDVVSFGNAVGDAGPLDSTRILVRRGPAELGRRVRAALGVGLVAMQPDSTRLLDASVLLGADFRPRPEFHP
jgi:LytR cell envelope-related transcriptional attenuator